MAGENTISLREGDQADAPWFTPGTPFWRVNREGVVGLAGMRALLMELAHPLIAAGVARHSDFQRRPLRRLYRTMIQMSRITFGSRRSAAHALQHIQRCHRRVRGTLDESSGACSAGRGYDAEDPDLKLWVLATLIDSSLATYELFIAPLTAEEKESYYKDGCKLGRLLGIPTTLMPGSFSDFSLYTKSMLDGNTLLVESDARRIADSLLGSSLLGGVVRHASFVSIGLLPQHLREAYGLTWDERRERRLLRLASLWRNSRPYLPEVVCVNPHAWLSSEHPATRDRQPGA